MLPLHGANRVVDRAEGQRGQRLAGAPCFRHGHDGGKQDVFLFREVIEDLQPELTQAVENGRELWMVVASCAHQILQPLLERWQCIADVAVVFVHDVQDEQVEVPDRLLKRRSGLFGLERHQLGRYARNTGTARLARGT